MSKSRWLKDYWAFISDSLCTASAQVNMQEPWKIFSFDLSSQKSYFMDEVFCRNMLVCFFALNPGEILVYLLLLYQDEETLVV